MGEVARGEIHCRLETRSYLGESGGLVNAIIPRFLVPCLPVSVYSARPPPPPATSHTHKTLVSSTDRD